MKLNAGKTVEFDNARLDGSMPHTILDIRIWEEFEKKLKELQEKAPDDHRPEPRPNATSRVSPAPRRMWLYESVSGVHNRPLWPNSLVAWNVTHSMFRICQIKYQKPYSMDRS